MPSADLIFPPAYAAFVAAFPPPVTTIDALGCHVPTFADCFAWYIAAYQSVYGNDTYLGPDSQDGSWVALQALALNRANSAVAAAYASFAPSTAQGVGLDSVVKVNGISRAVPTFSTVDLVVGGTVGVTVEGGAVSYNGTLWNVPEFTFPPAGALTVTATCYQPGAVAVPAGVKWQIETPTFGWQSVANLTPAVPGSPVENDPPLKARQAISAALPSLTVMGGLRAALLALSGVTSVTGLENSTQVEDENGLPGGTISMVVTGGDDAAVATTIFLKKGGCGTFGGTSVTVADEYGLTHRISFWRPQQVLIGAQVNVQRRAAYTLSAEAQAQSIAASYVSALPLGSDVTLYNVGGAFGGALTPLQGKVEAVLLARDGLPPVSADLLLAYYEQASLLPANVRVVYA